MTPELPGPVGFVLGGGGSLGAGQVGMLRALAEHGIAPDLVVGTSVGSVNGSLLALDPDGAPERLARIWKLMTRARVFPGGPIAQLRTLRTGKTHLFPNTGLADVISRGLGGATDFADLRLPFGAVAVDSVTGQPILLRTGELVPAILASSAIPGVYPPVRHEGHVLYDGGVLANVPIRQALAMGAKSLVVLDCAFPGHLPTVPRTLAETLLFWATLSMRNQAVLEVELASADVPVLYLPGPPVQSVTPLDFSHTAELIASSYTASTAFLDTVRVDGPGLYGAPGGPAVETL
ncbi:patatin-like phospholipase family protein [Umezawaea sp. Da 62-37]|uniref:patatin-like phospholipase family protein n=1 Tax=Umezawaea sp. Da 62-37 TaxID=3075927 RepID=UPI0028F6FFC2|nr:patatin-like phospholipase family protein [Umezawaea sp. Da 62-37]WNV89168.1 patatin-like phospholipase family protein [Umezawaea sp. Da 62-37]